MKKKSCAFCFTPPICLLVVSQQKIIYFENSHVLIIVPAVKTFSQIMIDLINELMTEVFVGQSLA